MLCPAEVRVTLQGRQNCTTGYYVMSAGWLLQFKLRIICKKNNNTRCCARQYSGGKKKSSDASRICDSLYCADDSAGRRPLATRPEELQEFSFPVLSYSQETTK